MGELSASGGTLSELLAPFRRYVDSGEINSRVQDQDGTIERIAGALADGRQDRLDGLTVEFDDWWCNVRASNTEPLLRLNVEAGDPRAVGRGDARWCWSWIRGGAA